MKPKDERIFNAIYEVLKDREITQKVINAILNAYRKEAAEKGPVKVLTKEDVTNLKTDKKGGYTSATTIALTGTNKKPTRGWKRRLVGKEILMQQYEAALKGRTVYA